MFGGFDAYNFALSMVALIICITVHEFAHAYAADRAGDNTPRSQGRISLNPLDHLDPMGTIMMVVSSLSGFGIGWGKPVQINPYRFRNPRWDDLKVSLWGPLSNVLMAAFFGSILRVLLAGGLRASPHAAGILSNMIVFTGTITLISIGLAMFNLIPVTPLDGSHIVSALLPSELARKYDFFKARNGMLIFLALILLGNRVLPAIIGPPSRFLWHLFTGM